MTRELIPDWRCAASRYRRSSIPTGVIDNTGELIGIVTERDYLRFAVKAIEMHD
jgi:hypothetical protein